MQKKIIICIIFALVAYTAFGQDSSAICKCGATGISYSCCAATDYCSTSFYYHCPDEHRVNSSLCTEDVPKCSKCRCGRTVFSYSCCKDQQHCSNGLVQHCSSSNRVDGCDATTPVCFGKSSTSFLDDEFAEYYVPEQEENSEKTI